MSEIVPEFTTVDEPLLPQQDTVLPSQDDVTPPSSGGDRALSILLLFLGLIIRRRGASLTVRQNVAQQLMDLLADWRYLLPIVVFDLIWNLALVLVSVVLMILTVHEKPNDLVRVWICGYSFFCVTHVFLVWMEYKRRNQRIERRRITIAECAHRTISSFLDTDETYVRPVSPYRRWDWLNTTIACVWWVIGFMLMVSGSKNLLHVAPRLFWLTVAFLAIDTFFAAVYILMSCLLVFSVSFCIPYVIVFMYFISGEDGASEDEINLLPRYKFEISNDEQQPEGRMEPLATSGLGHSVEIERLTKDVDCCICLRSYDDGSELHLLPCEHHFHVACILKWLMVSPTCPLCNYKIEIVPDVVL